MWGWRWGLFFSFFFPSLFLSNCRKANLILHRAEKISHYCRSLLHSTHIQSRTDTMAYVYCRSDEGRPPSNRQGSLHQSRTTCMEKLISVQRNTYSNTKLRWDRSSETGDALLFPLALVIDVPHQRARGPQNSLGVEKAYFCATDFY